MGVVTDGKVVAVAKTHVEMVGVDVGFTRDRGSDQPAIRAGRVVVLGRRRILLAVGDDLSDREKRATHIILEFKLTGDVPLDVGGA